VDPFTLAILSAVLLKPGWKWPPEAEPYRKLIAAASGAHSVPANLLARLLYTESRFRPDIIDGRVKSSAGALGIAQFMPATAASFGIDPLDPRQAIDASAKYLRQLRDRFGTWRFALIAYNWGQGNLQKALTAGRPPLVAAQAYADDILWDALA
jgi:soluble lytic murein transglycosylase-like protein